MSISRFVDTIIVSSKSSLDYLPFSAIWTGGPRRARTDEMVRQGYVAFNTARTMRVRRRARRAVIAEREKVVIPEKAEVKAMFGAEVATRGRAQLSIMCFAGLRIGEMRGIAWPRIDLEGGYIHVEEAADRFNHWGEVKTLAAKRTVPIGPFLARALKEWKLACPKGELGLAFPTSTGTVQSYANVVNRWFAPLLVEAGLFRVEAETDPKTKRPRRDPLTGEPIMRKRASYTPHSLRHFAVSLWIDEGASPKQVSEWAGHEDVAFTMRVYGHLFKDKARERDRIAATELGVLG